MWKRWCPRYQVGKLVDLEPAFLLEQGFKGIMIDLDNTLVNWGEVEVTPETVNWVKQAKTAGLKLCIVSNALEYRVKTVGELLEIPWVSRATKPRKAAFKKALAILKTKPEETATVGDQIFTDVWGGNRMALFTIWTPPLSTREFFFTRIVRRFERRVLKLLKKKGIISE
ncbi:MAG: YqeG family HAD IIIA-type phosphatase [Firmicutes bacterium]|nr:YqeG family HAD IIIA-type phosphatase [Bacillota bacterium]